jgi:hypothetical protein
LIMAANKTYYLTSLKDVFDLIPEDKIELCLAEIAKGMKQARAMGKILAASARELGFDVDGCAVAWPDTVTWIDDDKGELTMSVATAENADPLFTVRTSKQ